MRLRRKPWIDEAIHEYSSHVVLENHEEHKGKWRELFEDPTKPLYLELGTGKGRFIAGMAEEHPEANFLGFEVQLGVLYYAAQKIFEQGAPNARVTLFDIEGIEGIVEPGEVDRFYINFCDPWPKARHAKRRLTYHRFLERYARLLKEDGEVHFKTDNEGLFLFSLEEFKNAGWTLKNVTYDLHSTDLPNVKTEYEEKFSKKGQPIFRLEAIKPKEA
ncbi:MAG: tRNA (guanosine(46)-N7)-methyltransferase TrmB [Veillonella sp.]|uniref:tRNA (guanosine(46)-N7)-methyltransferase TrmB n=1 Tax=Veillonella sp. TaxID=1926307 RepID=UPI0025F78FC8|nr:tRNA (guanosine(46)-N7)-methyltransferase TrmB [Veillonella sp.]MBS4914270.1 tRNA (guanosine(46)-N7)-methyltransferase TrmB [Veillonella sp.]